MAKHPAFKKVDDGRVVIPAEFVPDWAKGVKKGEPLIGLRVMPLHWRRSLAPLPPERWLDGWYLWNTETAPDSSGWPLNPKNVIDKTIPDPEDEARFALLLFDASIDTQTRSHRLHCPSLLATLSAKANGGCWVVPEEDSSLSIWADGSFQLYFGRLQSSE